MYGALAASSPSRKRLHRPPKLRAFRASMSEMEEEALVTLEETAGVGGIVEKAFALPVVNATYDSLASLSTPLQPYAEKGVAIMSSMGESIKAGVQDKVPDALSAKVIDARGQVSAAVNSVDSSLCSGLDKLVDKVPALKREAPEILKATKSSVGSFAFMATTYVASFTVVSYALKFSEFGIEGAERILKMIPGEKKESLLSGLHWVRDETAVVRQEGAKRNGSERVLALENASLLEVLAGLLNCTRLLSRFGAQTASVDADTPVKHAPVVVTPVKYAPCIATSEDEEDLRSTSSSIEELLRTRHLSVDQIASTSIDQIDAEEFAKVDNEELAEVQKELNFGTPLRSLLGLSSEGRKGKGKSKK